MTTETPAGRELPSPAATFHVSHFRNAPSMRNTEFVEGDDFAEGAHNLYTADQMHAMYHQGREDGRRVVVTDAMVERACKAVAAKGPGEERHYLVSRDIMRAALVAALGVK